MSLIAFRANKGGSNQTGIADNVATQVTFGTEVFDNGVHFSSNVWIPPSGLVIVGAAGRWTGTISSGAFASFELRKNGVTIIANQQQRDFTNSGGDYCVGYDQANGTDAYSVWARIDLTAGSATISGTVEDTYFFGLYMGTFESTSFLIAANTVNVRRLFEPVGY